MPRPFRITVLLVLVALLLVSLVPRVAASRWPGNNQGYAPLQPIAYSHRLHAGELRIPCLYCHFGAEQSRHAGIPPANVCMNCHKSVTASFGAVKQEKDLAVQEGREPLPIVSDELQILFDAVEQEQPIRWIQVHRLEDFVYFDHSVHVNKGVECETCHGPVSTMERMRQDASLGMGWCIECHRKEDMNASTDCSACHF